MERDKIEFAVSNIEAVIFGSVINFLIKAESHEAAIEEFKDMSLHDVLKNIKVGEVVESFTATTDEVSDVKIHFTCRDFDDDLDEEEEELDEEEENAYDFFNVHVGDYVKIHEGEFEPYLYVTAVYKETFDCQSDYGRHLDVPYGEIIDLKMESEVFEVSGNPRG